jgi:N-acetylglucosamine-6-phosphate deacetylase
MPTFIDQALMVFPGERTAKTGIRFDHGKVAAIGADAARPDDTVIKANGRLLTPGLVDLHIHGIQTFRFDAGPDELLAAAGCFAKFGTTTILPTLVPKKDAGLLERISALVEALPKARGVSMPGLHLEGPFTALSGAGCDVVPGDLALLDEMLAAGQGRIRAMSLSPDTPNILPVIEHLRERGVASFVTHTRATLAQAQAAIAAGATHATHFYDVFPIPPESDPGVRPLGAVEAYLADPDATVDFIADGCHVHPLAIQLAVRAKTWRGVALITDANIGAGLPPGKHETPWGFPVQVEPGNGARIADPKHPFYRALAGSALTMNVGMANLLKWIQAPPEQVWAMGTSNPARIAGLANTGSLAIGQDADAVLWNDDLTPATTWVRGEAILP